MAVLFDTLKLAERLKAAGMPPRQARDMAGALAETMTGEVVTRDYFDRRLAETEAKLRGWMIGRAFAIVGALAALYGIAVALIRLLH